MVIYNNTSYQDHTNAIYGQRSNVGGSRGVGGGFGAGLETNVGKGSKSPQAPAQESAMATAQANDWAAQQQYNREQAAANAAKQEAAAKEATQRGKTQSDVARMYGEGQTYGTSHLGQLGYADTYGIMDRYNAALNSAKGKVPEMATDVGAYFNTDQMWQNALNEAQGAQRGKLNTEYSNFAKPGWEQNYFADTSDDAILEAILGGQQTDTENALKAKLARGQLSQQAYDYATSGLGDKSTAAMSTLQDLGGGVLNKYRGELDTLANQYSDRVTNYQLGQNVNMNDLQTGLTNKQTGLQGSMKGDILKALGSTKLFDIDALSAAAGTQTGASNTPLQDSFQNQAAEEQRRSTGTTGIF